MHTNVTDLSKTMSDTLDKVISTKERVIIERDGKPAAALISLEDLEYLEALDAAEEEEDLRICEERKDEETVSLEEVKKRMGF